MPLLLSRMALNRRQTSTLALTVTGTGLAAAALVLLWRIRCNKLSKRNASVTNECLWEPQDTKHLAACYVAMLRHHHHSPSPPPSSSSSSLQLQHHSIHVVSDTESCERLVRLLREEDPALKMIGLDAEWESVGYTNYHSSSFSLSDTTAASSSSSSSSSSAFAPTIATDHHHTARQQRQQSSGKIALLQLSSSRRTLLIQMQQLKAMPSSLVRLLQDANIFKFGVGCVDDARRLLNDYQVVVRGCVELGLLLSLVPRSRSPPSSEDAGGEEGNQSPAATSSSASSSTSSETAASSSSSSSSLSKLSAGCSLRTMTRACVGVDMLKDERTRRSRWAQPLLTQPQILYGAADAFYGLQVGYAMLHAISGGVGLDRNRSSGVNGDSGVGGVGGGNSSGVGGEKAKNQSKNSEKESESKSESKSDNKRDSHRHHRASTLPPPLLSASLDYQLRTLSDLPVHKMQLMNANLTNQPSQRQRKGQGQGKREGNNKNRGNLDENEHKAIVQERLQMKERRRHNALVRKVGPLYENCVMLGPDGEFMCSCDRKKAMWYLNRDLASKLKDEPLTIQLTFSPKGHGNRGNKFYESRKRNACVVCGTEESLLRHNTVPAIYRRHFPVAVKSHSSHDIVLLCTKCHTEADCKNDFLRQQLSNEVGVPLNPRTALSDDARVIKRAVSAATALLKHSTLPLERQMQLKAEVSQYLNKSVEEITQQDLQDTASQNYRSVSQPEHGLAVFKRYCSTPADLRAFCARWRKYFLDSMQPQHLSPHWEVDHVKPNDSDKWELEEEEKESGKYAALAGDANL